MNTIFKYTGDPLSDNETTLLYELGVSYVGQVPEMKTGFIQALCGYPTPFEDIKALLESKGDVEVVGIWNEEGLQYGYEYQTDNTIPENPITTVVRSKDLEGNDLIITYPFDIEKYRLGLLNYQEVDENGDIVVDREYTTIEARNKQVNKFGGRIDRYLY